jgi:hypothetical protein
MTSGYRSLLFVCVAAASGCAALVSYDGFGGGAGTTAADATGIDDTGKPDAHPSDAGDAAAPWVKSCVGLAPGIYCGRSLRGYDGNTQDLVHCWEDGGHVLVTHCAAGCASMPPGHQDMCNACRSSGTYCAQELNGDYPHYDVLVYCDGGTTLDASACRVSCVFGGPDATCR